MIVQGIEERVFFSLTDTTGKIIKAGGFFDIYELKNFLADLPVGEQIRMFESIVVLARRAIEAGNKMMTVSGLNDPACHNEWNQAVAPFGGGFWQENGYAYYKTIEHFEIVIRQEIGALKQKASDRTGFFLSLLQTESPGTYQAIERGMQTGRVSITRQGKIDFKCISKGTLAHVFKKGGYTEWSRVSNYITLDGEEITGTLKTLASNEPPQDFAQIEKELFPE